MKKKSFLVTGGSGFIGTNFCEIVSKKHKVLNIDKLTYCSVPEKYKINFNKNYKFNKVDLAQIRRVFKIMNKNKFDYLVNFASETHVDRSIENPRMFIKKNIDSNLLLIDIIRLLFVEKKLKKNFKFIHISTDEVYGSKFKPVNENGKLLPNSPYASSKASIDLFLRSYGKTYNFPYIICRPSNNFGPYQFPEKLIPTVISKILNNKKIPVYGNGENLREWTYVKDTCNAILNLSLNSKIHEVYNIGSGIRISNINLIKIILKELGIPKNQIKNHLEFVRDRPGHDVSYSLNSKKLKKKLKYFSFNKKKIEEKLKETVKWYLKNTKWLDYCFKKFDGRRIG